MFFQTTSGSWASVAAFDWITSVRVDATPLAAAGIEPTFHVIRVGVTVNVPPLERALTKDMPFGAAAMLTVTPERAVVVGLVTITRDGYWSPGLTQPTAETNEFSIVRPFGMTTRAFG